MAGNRVWRWMERLTLGAIMSVAAFVVERRLMKVIRERGKKQAAEAERGPELRPPPP